LLCFGSVAHAEIYKKQWKKFWKRHKMDYVHGVCNGQYFALRSVYLLNIDQTNNKFDQLLPLGNSVEEIVEIIDIFYQDDNTEKISVSWALYIISQEKHGMSADRILELRKTAIEDYETFSAE
jgi:hypothetical protein